MNTLFRVMLHCCVVVAGSWACHLHAESGSYRVEILVFRHTQNQELPEPDVPMSHFPQSWDPPASIGRRIPEDPAFLSARSDLMQEAWRKLSRRLRLVFVASFSATYESRSIIRWEVKSPI